MFKKIFLPMLIVSGLIISGCSSTGDIKEGDGAVVEDIGTSGQTTEDQAGGTADGASAAGLPGQAPFQGHPLDNPSWQPHARNHYP